MGEAVAGADHEVVEVEPGREPGGDRVGGGPVRSPARPRRRRGVGEGDLGESGGAAAEGVGRGGAVAALEPVADAVGPGDVEAAPLDPDRPQRLEPVLEGGGRQRVAELLPDSVPDRRQLLSRIALQSAGNEAAYADPATPREG